MATPLTDSINALTTYANEVTGASDTTLSDAVHTLASGYGQGGGVNYLDIATGLGAIYNGAYNMPQRIEFSPIALASGNVNGYFMTRAYESGNRDRATIDLIVHFQQSTPFQLRNFLFQAYGVKTVTFTGDLSHVTSYQDCLGYGWEFEELNIVFDFSSCTDAISVRLMDSSYNTKVTKMRFVPNTLAFTSSYAQWRALDADSLISLANCLRADVTGQTLTLYSTQLSLCSSTMGNNDNGTFVADENGTMSLADFITNVKGWTLA